MPAETDERRVVLYELLSLDGVAEEPGDWSSISPELIANLGRIIATQDDVILGHATYDYWSDYWPSATIEPFAAFINGVRKHVVARESIALDWANSTRATGPLGDYVAALKRQTGRDIGIHGSIAVAQALLRAGLVDELRLVVAPALAGTGRRLFPDDGTLNRLALTSVDRCPDGTVLLAYGAERP